LATSGDINMAIDRRPPDRSVLDGERLGSQLGKWFRWLRRIPRHTQPRVFEHERLVHVADELHQRRGDCLRDLLVLSDGSTGQNNPGTQAWSSIENTGISTASSGGPQYGWLPTEDVSGLPLAQVALKLN
jgi:hypothetical protein